MSFFTGNNFCDKCGKPLGIFEQGTCVECEKAEQEPTADATLKDIFCMGCEYKEQEPCDDVVSRQAVLDLAEKGILVSNGNYKSVCKAINELPSVRPQERGKT